MCVFVAAIMWFWFVSSWF